jgi:NTE family protein
MEIDKKTIHFILPGGGVRGCFQAGFIYHLQKNYSHLFEIYKIDGTSVGALNGMALLFENPEHIKDIWFSLQNMETIFNPWTDKHLWNKLKTMYQGFFNKSLYQNDGLQNIVKNNIDKINKKHLDKYNCVVTNLYTGEYEYINGSNEHISDYIIASASPWIIAPIVSINNYMYIDGGLLQTYPVKQLKNSKADIKLLVGYDIGHKNKLGMSGDNLITYLARVIDISRLNQSNIHKITKYINKYNIITVENPLQYPFLDFSIENITNGFEKGIEAADIFAKNYLLQI